MQKYHIMPPTVIAVRIRRRLPAGKCDALHPLRKKDVSQYQVCISQLLCVVSKKLSISIKVLPTEQYFNCMLLSNQTLTYSQFDNGLCKLVNQNSGRESIVKK